jgi:hypothetical protein
VAANIAAILAEDGSYFLNIKEHGDDGERIGPASSSHRSARSPTRRGCCAAAAISAFGSGADLRVTTDSRNAQCSFVNRVRSHSSAAARV